MTQGDPREPGLAPPVLPAPAPVPEPEPDVPVPPDRLERVLAAAKTPKSLIDVAAVAEAARRLCMRVKRNTAMQNNYALIRLKALRKLGKLLASMPKNPGAARLRDVTTLPPTLAKLGISKRDSCRWQKLAEIPEGLFREHVRKVTASDGQLTEASFHTLVRRLHDDAGLQDPEQWSVETALQRLRRTLDVVLNRCPTRDSRDVIISALRMWASEVEQASGAQVHER